MKKRSIKIIVIMLCTLAVLWSAIFVTDYIRCSNMKEPIFVIGKELADDGMSGAYKGLGYTVNVRMYENLEGEISPLYIEMKLFGITVVAVIV